MNLNGGVTVNPIETRHPAEVAFGGGQLNKRQQRILDALPDFGSRVIVNKKDVSMLDLSALTAKTGDEFAMFTRKGKRLIVRGDSARIPLNSGDIIYLRDAGYRWSGHTHPGFTETNLIASGGDKKVLALFRQSESVIYNASGRYKLIEGERYDEIIGERQDFN